MEMASVKPQASASPSGETVEVGPCTLTITSGAKDGKITCHRNAYVPKQGMQFIKVGDLDFSLLQLKAFENWDYLGGWNSALDGDARCLLLGHIENDYRNIPGVGAACVYAFAVAAERRQIKHMIVLNAVGEAFGFYEKMGFKRFDQRCFDFYGETATVKHLAQESATKR